MPKVSVVIPVYDGEAFVADSIHSILAQTFQDFELIVVDDASKDDSQNIVCGIHDSRIRLLRHTVNQGVAHATNTGVRAATGDYIALLDQDDIALPSRLEKQVRFLNGNAKVAVVGGQMQCFGAVDSQAHAPVDDGTIKANLLAGAANVYNPTVMLRRSFVVEKSLEWNPDHGSAFDWGFFTIVMLSGGRFANLPDVITRYRIHDKQQSKDQSGIRPVLQSIRIRIMESYFPRLSDAERLELEPLLQWVQPPSIERSKVQSGLTLIKRASAEIKSYRGEKRAAVNNFLAACYERWEKALA